MKARVTAQSHPTVVNILKGVYPEYRGRKFYLTVAEKYRVWDFWDGGSRTYTTFVDLDTGRQVSSDALPGHLRQKEGNWFNLPISDYFPLPEHIGVVEHHIFCGKDTGLTLVVSPERQAAIAPPSEGA